MALDEARIRPKRNNLVDKEGSRRSSEMGAHSIVRLFDEAS
jgi:hypothetical protein